MIFLKLFCKPVIALGLAAAETSRFAFRGDAQSLDPYGLDAALTMSLLDSVYEGLTRYDGNPARIDEAARILRPDDVLDYRCAVMP